MACLFTLLPILLKAHRSNRSTGCTGPARNGACLPVIQALGERSNKMTPNLEDLYSILRNWALAKKPRTYGDLSRAYQERTGVWFEPHGNWDRPLGELNNRLATIGAPALSALVILQGANEPGGGFWGCSPNAPRRPANEIERLEKWNSILEEVRAYSWPENLPV